MSFVQAVDAEIQHLAPLFAAAEKADRDFHKSWKETVAKIGADQYQQTERYRQTLDHFHAATQTVDTLVMTAFVQAKLGDHASLPRLFAYVSLPGRYFRSGYQRATIWRFLKKLPLDDEQNGILRSIAIQQIESAGPEFLEISRAATGLDSADLREELNRIASHTDKGYVRYRVKRLLARLERA